MNIFEKNNKSEAGAYEISTSIEVPPEVESAFTAGDEVEILARFDVPVVEGKKIKLSINGKESEAEVLNVAEEPATSGQSDNAGYLYRLTVKKF